MNSGELGAFRGLRFEFPRGDEGTDLARVVVPRTVDVIRSLIGEIEALTATGDPPGQHPDLELVVQLRAAEARRAELRAWSAAGEPARLTLAAANGSLTLEFDPALQAILSFDSPHTAHGEEHRELDPWDPHEAIFAVLTASCGRARQHRFAVPEPARRDSSHGTGRGDRAQPRRGRTVDLHYEPISEESNFKSVMTSTGCMILIGALFAVLFALCRPAARLQLDDLHRLSHPADPGDLRGLADATIRRARARSIGGSVSAERERKRSR